MIVHDAKPFFINRIDAGLRLADELDLYKKEQTVVYAIPRGGAPVAVEVARKLNTGLDLVIARKIPIPFEPEAGYGAVTEDGTVVLNEPLFKRLRISKEQAARHAEEVKSEIERRDLVYRKIIKPISPEGKTAIVIDDGLASGYTMMAAIKSLHRRRAAKVVAAVPVASESAWELLRPAADDLVSLVVAYVTYFSVASFYRQWHDLSDIEVIEALENFTGRTGAKQHG
jgi:putative phosphoribosyl transferase